MRRRLAKRDAISPHRPRDVFETLLTKVDECGLDPAIHLLLNHIGNADAAGLANAFKPRRDVDSIAEDVVVLDYDVTDVDADAKLDFPCSGGNRRFRAGIPRWMSMAQRTASTVLGIPQGHTVTGRFHDAASDAQ